MNVYQLITRGTLEEKIMGLQWFKLNIATSIVNQQNSNLGSMNMDQILDLFNVSSGNAAPPGKSGDPAGYNHLGLTPAMGAAGGKKNMLDGIKDLPPESKYKSVDPAKFRSSL
ncbi:hypothetical protein PCASD_06841 [Puccinia coronata f. sp. avenae]|uniref:Uncharacterized protein n=1 Tax=Puccinia coronata f. sp. avenae TaxID=200324 RepID=A0A2N5UQD1_9BASI|nr:hypothetical protein PCASD_06841 [Puccinia coronata f. sp. avenae]